MLQSQSALGAGNNLNNFLGTLAPQLAALGTLLQGGASGTQNVLSLLGNGERAFEYKTYSEMGVRNRIMSFTCRTSSIVSTVETSRISSVLRELRRTLRI